MIADPTARIDLLMDLHREIDRAGAGLSRDLGIPICVPGCGLCCWTVPMVRGNEIKMVLEYLTHTPLVHLGVQYRLMRWLLEPSISPRDGSSYPTIPLSHRGQILEGSVPDQIESEFQSLLRSRCPLLTDTNRCLIYDVRPLMCRGYGITMPADLFCKRPLGPGETQAHRIFVQPCDDRRGQRAVVALEHWMTLAPWMGEYELLPTAIYRRWYPNFLATSQQMATVKFYRRSSAGDVNYTV